MTNEALLDPQTQKIIKRYTTLYKLIFQYSIFFIPLILSVIWAFSLQSSKSMQPIVPTYTKFESYTNENWLYKASRVSDQIWPIFDWRGEIKILGGELQATWNVLIGRNNLITVWGIILPNKPYIIDFSFTGDITTFNKPYALEDLKRVLDNWILSTTLSNISWSTNTIVDSMFLTQDTATSYTEPTNMDEILAQLKKRMFFNSSLAASVNALKTDTIIVPKKDIISEYNLSCLEKRKVYDWFCSTNIANFIDKLPDIQLDGAWEDITTIAYAIKKEDQKDAFCANIMANVLRQPYPTPELDNIMNNVCKPYNSRYTILKDFLKIQNELDSIISEGLITNNVDLNLFKLSSLRQKIAMQNSNKGLDTTTVIAYLKFLDTLIHQSNITIPQFYLETAYYFNNLYLKSMLKSLSINSLNPTVKAEVNNINEQINAINKWNTSLGIKGLEKMVINTQIVQIANNNVTGSLYNTIANFEQVFKDVIASYPDIRVTSLQTDEATRTARIFGTLRYNDTNTPNSPAKNITIVAQFEYKDGQFVVWSLRTPYDPNIDTILTSFMAKNKWESFGILLDVIKNNTDYTKTNITLCDILRAQSSIIVSSCDTSRASITLKNTVITFSISNNAITKAATANNARQTYFQNMLKNWPIGQERIRNVLEAVSILWNDNTNDTDNTSIETEKIAIVEKFKKFLWVEPTAIVFKNDKRITTFTLKNYSFATVVAIDKNYKLSPLVIEVNKQIITISNFSLSLIPFSQTRITAFIDDPMEYIKSIDTVAYEKIQKALGK